MKGVLLCRGSDAHLDGGRNRTLHPSCSRQSRGRAHLNFFIACRSFSFAAPTALPSFQPVQLSRFRHKSRCTFSPAATKNDRGDIIPCHFHLSNYMQVYPPSTGRATPVTYDDLGEARNTAAVSSSPSLPYLSIGIIVLAFAWKKSLSRVSLVRSV